MSWDDLTRWLANQPLVRQVADSLLRARSRRGVAVLDNLSAKHIQGLTLSRLVRKGLKTRFGRDHDFRRIRNAADFRRLVPLCTTHDLWHAYWSPGYPHLDGLTWPGKVTLPPGKLNGTKPIPTTAETLAAQRKALATALGFTAAVRPRVSLAQGNILWVEDSPSVLSAGPRALPAMMRPWARVWNEPAPHDDTLPGLKAAAEQWGPLSCVIGEPGRLVRLLSALRRTFGVDGPRDLWPGLAAVIFTQKTSTSQHDKLRELVAVKTDQTPVLLLEIAVRLDCPLAVEDPRLGSLRVLPHLGVYYEFVPVGEVHSQRPTRLGLEDVEPGESYAVAVTTPSGLWACLTGLTVCFERRDPPLVRVVASTPVRESTVPQAHPWSGQHTPTFKTPEAASSQKVLARDPK